MIKDGTENLCLWCMEEMGENPVCPHCGHERKESTSDAQYLPLGTLLYHERYLIGRVLGAGGFGITYLAYDCVLQIKRAVKEFYPQNLVFRSGSSTVKISGAAKIPSFQKGMESFHKEALSLARFGAHPNVVKIHDFFEENGTAYFVMDYVEGQSFTAYLKSHGNKLSWEETLRILRPIGNALTALHSVGLLHRDIKPDNIFITRGGKPILLDFGSARYSTSGDTNSLTSILTPGYAPMEQYGTKHQGSWTDVYAYAATFYRAISGITPPISTERIAEDELVPLNSLDSNIPEAISGVIAHGMAVKVLDRIQTIADFLAVFDTPLPPPPPLPQVGEDDVKTILSPLSDRKQIIPILPEKPSLSEGSYCTRCFTVTHTSGGCPECGYLWNEMPPQPEHCLPLRTRLKENRYQIGKVLGAGGFGITYLVYDWQEQVRRAIKEFYPQNLAFRSGSVSVSVSGPSKGNSFKKGLESFHNEARALETFGTHPNVVKIHDYFEENGTAYYVMDYVEGESFQSYLKSHGEKLAWEEALRLLAPIGDALCSLHEARLLHRDIKPANIFITRAGKPVLLDFGSARYVASGETNSLTSILTPGYAPIEQYGTRHQGPWTDVYAFAATFYRAVSGLTPQISTDRPIDERLQPLKELNSDLPESISDAVNRAMAIKIADRTQSVAEFLSCLRAQVKDPVDPSENPEDISLEKTQLRQQENLPVPPQKNADTNPEDYSQEKTQLNRQRDLPVSPQDKAEEYPEGHTLGKTRLCLQEDLPVSPQKNADANPEAASQENHHGLHLLETGTVLNGKHRIDRVEDDDVNPVYLARNTELNVNEYIVECRQLHQENMPQGVDAPESVNRKALDNFCKSAQYFANCGHRNLMRVNSLFRENHTAYAVVPYREGCSLLQYLEEHQGKISWRKALGILKPISQALTELHRRQLVYRNLKPDRIYLCADGTPLLWKFETLSSMLADHEDDVLLTPGYAPVEQYGTSPLGSAADVYALAAVFYRMVSGSVPIPATDRLLTDPLLPLNRVDSRVPESISEAVSRAMAVQRENRTQTAAQFLQEMEYAETSVSSVLEEAQEEPSDALSPAIQSAKAGDHVFYGCYKPDTNFFDGPKPIEWRVLKREENRLLLISEYGFDERSFHAERKTITWETCTLRTWLNREFIEKVFSAEEKQHIAETIVKAEKNPSSSIPSGKNTKDRLFLLNIQEVKAFFPIVENRKCKAMPYGDEKQEEKSDKNASPRWWLRSSGNIGSRAVCIRYDGIIDYSGIFVDDSKTVVRPAFWLNL